MKSILSSDYIKFFTINDKVSTPKQISLFIEDCLSSQKVEQLDLSGNLTIGNGSTEFITSTYDNMLQAALADPTSHYDNAAKVMNNISNELSTIAYNNISGQNSIAIGGYALGDNSIAIGHLDREGYFPDNAIATGKNSIALGNIAIATGLGAVALGSGIAKGNYSLAVAGGVATDRCAIAIENTQANAQYSIALGDGSKTEKYFEEDGSLTLSNNVAATSIGKNTYSSGRGAIAIGTQTSAIGIGPIAIGYITKATGKFSIATGTNTHANGAYSYAGGNNAESLSNNSGSYVWNGDSKNYSNDNKYKSHNSGSFNIAPLNGLNGFYIGEETLCSIIDNAISNNITSSLAGSETISVEHLQNKTIKFEVKNNSIEAIHLSPTISNEISTSTKNINDLSNDESTLICSLINVNLFDSNNLSVGKYYPGSWNNNAAYSVYYNIPMVKGVTYKILNNKARWFVLRKDGAIVESISESSPIITEITPNHSGIGYITVQSNRQNDMLIPNINSHHEIDVAKNTLVTNCGRYDLFDKNNLSIGYYFDTSYHSNSIYDYYFKIPVLRGLTYTCIPNSKSNSSGQFGIRGYSILDETDKVLESKFVETKTMTPSYDGYANVTIYHSDLSTASLIVANKSKANGKKILAIGDSYTAGAWPGIVQTATNCIMTNAGVSSGRIVSDTTSGGQIVKSFINRLDDYNDQYDFVFVFGGINDSSDIASGQIQLGDMTSALDTTTFYGGMRFFIEKLVEKMNSTSLQIIGIIPPGIINKSNLEQVQEAERTIYAYYGIPYIDLAKKCYQLNQNIIALDGIYRNAYTSDAYMHPTGKGYAVIARQVLAYLESH